MDRNRRRRAECRTLADQRGFTLVELMITLAVVVLALGGYVAANTAINQRTQEIFEQSTAIQDANSVIERMRNSSTGGQFPASVTGVFPNNTPVQGFTALPNEQVTVLYADPAADPLDVTVRVSWRSRGVRQAATDLRTFITRRTS